MNSYPEKLQDFIDTISLLPEENERINILIDYAEKFKEVPPKLLKNLTLKIIKSLFVNQVHMSGLKSSRIIP